VSSLRQEAPGWKYVNWTSIAAAIVLGYGAMAQAEEPAATPYRPTVANPAELPVPGWLEIEAGWLRQSGQRARREALPYTAKLAFSEDWGVLLGGELHVRDRDNGETVSGAGDTALVLKHRIEIDEQRAFGIEAGVNLPTAGHDLGSGKPDWTLTGIYSVDFAQDWRLDLNAGLTRTGAPEASEGRVVKSWAASVSRGVERWTFAGELSGSHRAGVSDSTQALAAASYAVTPALVVDVGASMEEQGGQWDHALFLGATWLAGKLL
jgi:hypothetical protein